MLGDEVGFWGVMEADLPQNHLTPSCSWLQRDGDGGAGRADLRVRRVRRKLVPQLRGVLFSRNEQVRARRALKNTVNEAKITFIP